MSTTPCSLTVFLGGAGMIGDYNKDMIKALTEQGIHNPVFGNYSSLTRGLEKYLPSMFDMLSDAAAVMFYNQDENDPQIIKLGDQRNCVQDTEIESETEFLGVRVRRYKKLPKCELVTGKNLYYFEARRDLSKKINHIPFSLHDIGITRSLPSCGQFNLIGYSWGAVIAARTALYYARKGKKVDHLALIGAPINKSLLNAVSKNGNIKKVLLHNLGKYGDPIYAGMTDDEIFRSAQKLATQMPNGEGHFYYSSPSHKGKKRRRDLVKILYEEGVK
jgi:hypothetical protein